MAGYQHPAALEREALEREERVNERLNIANRTEAMRNALREHYDANPTAGAVGSTLEALDAILDDTRYPDWLIDAIRPDLRGEGLPLEGHQEQAVRADRQRGPAAAGCGHRHTPDRRQLMGHIKEEDLHVVRTLIEKTPMIGVRHAHGSDCAPCQQQADKAIEQLRSSDPQVTYAVECHDTEPPEPLIRTGVRRCGATAMFITSVVEA